MGDPLKSAYLRAKAVEYLQHFMGLPYVWGGDDPMAGFDCSGLIVEVLRALGILGIRDDYTAHDLYTIFKLFEVEEGYPGCLVFWFNAENRAQHVEMVVDNGFVIGASGGGSATQSLADAVSQNAFVKMRPLTYRGVNFKIVDPFMEAA